MNCLCNALGQGAQTFRIRNLSEHFETLEELGALPSEMITDRKRLSCRHCNHPFVLLSLLFDRGEEEILMRLDSNDEDWKKIADKAGNCRWRGPHLDEKFLL